MIISKIFSGADELTRAVKSMKDLSALLPQMRLFLTFLDSLLEGESNFKMVLLVLETYGVLIDRMRHKVKPHLRSICSALLRHASNNKIVVRIENYRVVKKLMLVSKPNVVLNHMFDHLGDKRSVVREDVLNIVMYALLTFPSNEFDLKVSRKLNLGLGVLKGSCKNGKEMIGSKIKGRLELELCFIKCKVKYE